MTTHLSHEDLVLHFYGEAREDAAHVDAHLATCAECRAAFGRLQHALAMVDDAPVPDPTSGLEARVWARIEEAIEAPTPWWRRLLSTRGVVWVPVGSLAGVAVAAFLAGWLARDVPSRETPTTAGTSPVAPVATEAQVRTRVLLVAVGDHLERSEMVLSELVNAPDRQDARFAIERASDLVAANRLYRQSAAGAGDDALEDTLDDLERMLQEIANAPADVSADDLAALREGVERRGLLFRVRVLTDDVRARQQGSDTAGAQAAPRPKGPTS